MSRDATDGGGSDSPVVRRKFLKALGGTGVVATAGCTGGGGGGDEGGGGEGGTTAGSPSTSEPLADTLTWLGWEHYQVEDIIKPFEEKYNVEVKGSYFDANSSAYNTLKTGGTSEFDVVMADGFWPQLYFNEDLIQPLDYDRIGNLQYLHDDFTPPELTLFQVDGNNIATPNCWGGYGVTYNTEKIDEADASSIQGLLYNEQYKNHISTSGRSQLNVANTGIMLGYDQPKGEIWNACGQDKLNNIKQQLIKQKDLLVTRYSSTKNLERLFRSGQVWAAPEWSGVYRRLKLDGEPFEHTLLFDEGGLGWVDTWMMTAGVESEAKRNLVYKWMDWRLRPEMMTIEAKQVGWSPCIDIRDRISEQRSEALFQNRTSQIHKLTQFDTPKCPGKWEQVWNEMQKA